MLDPVPRKDLETPPPVGFVRADVHQAALDRIARLEAAVTAYHLSLDRREHGGIAGNRLVDAVQNILGMPWNQGAALAAIQEVPQ